MDARDLGSFGERRAANFLRLRGYRIREMNYKCRHGEIDVIAENRKYLVFVEVKLRKDSRFAEAKEFVTPAKQQRVILAAQSYLQNHGTEKQPRFDVIEIYAPQGEQSGNIRLNHIENAFGE